MSDHLPFYLGFSHFLGIGPIRFKYLVAAFGDVEKAYEATEKDIAAVISSDVVARKFVGFRRMFDPEKQLKQIVRKQITVLSQEDSRFPQVLREISDAPICLYVKGNIDLIDFNGLFFGVVGTRKPTSYGSHVAALFSSGLAASGFTIVSGLALGIDAISHETCIESGGKTVAFLGCGVDIVYPYSNKKLYEKIVNGGGLVISEFPPGMTVLKGLFIARNRLISGLSKGVLVVEGAKDSGSLVTARYAAEQGKDVFAPPVPINSAMSEAPNMLLRQGAKFVTSVQDILDEYNLQQRTNNSKQITVKLIKEEQEMCDALKVEPLSADELALKLEKTVSEIMQIISALELRGIIRKNDEARYQI